VKKNTNQILPIEAADNSDILHDFELTIPEKKLNEQELLDYLAQAISYMIEYKMDYLLSLLYRLDVDENKINNALLPGNPEPAHVALARLVLERQKQRVATKMAYKQQNIASWDWEMEE
jgi:hypothetical protein